MTRVSRLAQIQGVKATGGKTGEAPLASAEAGRLGLRGLAPGAGGSVWYTQGAPPAVGRLDADFGAHRWLLPEGMDPGEIVAGPDGRVTFTLVGRSALGSFRPAGPRPADPSAASSWEVQAAPRPRPARPRLTGRERRERALAREVLTVEAVEGELPSAGDPKPSGPNLPEAPKTPAEPTPAEERKTLAEPAPAAGQGPWEVLEALDFHLSDQRLAHILDRHSHGLSNTRGQFLPGASTRDGLVALIAKGLVRAGEVGRVVKRFDPRGILHTPCRMDAPVGHTFTRGTWKETRCFDVVTLRVDLEDGTLAQVVLSAYPVPEGAF